MQYQKNIPDQNPVLVKTIKQIEDAFRPERNAKGAILLNGHRVKALVEDGRYSMTEACNLLNVSHSDVLAALIWMVDDNARLNVAYDTEVHHCNPSDYIMVGWFEEQGVAVGQGA